MYLARRFIHNKTRYYIRESFKAGSKGMMSRDLFDLGDDPRRFIIYPGGRSYYIDPCVEEALLEQGIIVNQNDLDGIFFEFLRPETRRVIAGFDRSCKSNRDPTPPESYSPVHAFDKRRYHFLRFGSRDRLFIERVPEKIFRPLMNKSRDEIEQYFFTAEQILKPGENLKYISTIFELDRFPYDPDSDQPVDTQLDHYFTTRLCQINEDPDFTAGVAVFMGLYEHLVKYAIMYFDARPMPRSYEQEYIRDFINRHRTYTPPPGVRVKIREAERLFDCSWKELQRMDRSSLSKKYRQMALRYHPDQGGEAKAFHKLTIYYRALLRKKA